MHPFDEGTIGRGGVARVRVVRDGPLDRRVAMKILDAEAASPDGVERFLAEARLSARLEHPHIVPVYACGVDDKGIPWFTMRRIAGRTLDAELHGRSGPRTPDELHTLLDVFLKVCDALAFAHAHGIVHRDLKPQNIVLGDYGEVYLLDWGSAMIIDGVRDEDGIVFGTPAYCAPEQARGENSRIERRTDVFGLGAILYEIVTGQPPYSGRTVGEVLRLAQHALVRPPEAIIGNDAPPELARIAMTALALEPSQRFSSVEDLRREVQAFVRSAWNFRTEHFRAGVEIVRQGDVGTEAYILQSGRCQVTKTDELRCMVLRVLGPGDVFGEAGALTGLPRSASVRALEDVTVAVIRFEDLQHRLALDTWSGKLVRTLADRFRDVDADRSRVSRHAEQLEVTAHALRFLVGCGGVASTDELVPQVAGELSRDAVEVLQVLSTSPMLEVLDGMVRVRFEARR